MRPLLTLTIFILAVVELCSGLRLSRHLHVPVALLIGARAAFGVVDCKLDCEKNCLLAAPGSREYCVESCKDYCEQPDREDGLSGSVSGAKGETGIFGGGGLELLEGTPVIDRPPRGPQFIDSALSRQYGASSSRINAESRHK